MSLQRRLFIYILVCAPLVWVSALVITIGRARHEINELYDSEIIRLARQVQATLPDVPVGGLSELRLLIPKQGDKGTGEADLRDLTVAVWDAQGRLTLADREGIELERITDATGFVDESIGHQPWRIYYLQSSNGQWLVAAGQKSRERDDLVYALTVSQLLPWVLVLPVLLLVMAWAIRRALSPLKQISSELSARKPDDLLPVDPTRIPNELLPLVKAMNGLFKRIEAMVQRERRFTADAAHELRNPLAVLRVQWDVVRRSNEGPERILAEDRFSAALKRMDRLVLQMLELSKVDSVPMLQSPAVVDWSSVVEDALTQCLDVAERRGVELACEWPKPGTRSITLHGDPGLLTTLLRNLVDNGARYAPPGTTVTLRIGSDRLEVENAGKPLSEDQRAALGRRFSRTDGQAEIGSGLGVSIVQRIATLHGLSLLYTSCEGGEGVRVVLKAAGADRSAPLEFVT